LFLVPCSFSVLGGKRGRFHHRSASARISQSIPFKPLMQGIPYGCRMLALRMYLLNMKMSLIEPHSSLQYDDVVVSDISVSTL
jgi:hypothetical protein